MNGDDSFDALVRVFRACAGLMPADQLSVLTLAWIASASQTRNEALFCPGGFSEQREHQLRVLQMMDISVRDGAPDFELEKLRRENDVVGLTTYCRGLAREFTRGLSRIDTAR
jgi:hypothetical protein